MPRPHPFRFAVPVSALLIVVATRGALAQSPAPPSSSPPSGAQQQFVWPSHPGNIKVLPKSATGDQLRDVMVGFTRALGVRCPYCHVGEEGKPLTTFDFQSDARPTKRIARDMLRMVADIDKDLARMKLRQDVRRVNVGCVTCHHGKPRPTTLADELMVTYERAGIDSTILAYQALRGRFYGRDVYDFGENGLGELAAALAKKGRTDDAIQIYRQIVQQDPQSPRAYGALAQALEAAGRKQEAIDAYTKVLQLEPQNPMAKRRLDELQGGGGR